MVVAAVVLLLLWYSFVWTHSHTLTPGFEYKYVRIRAVGVVELCSVLAHLLTLCD